MKKELWRTIKLLLLFLVLCQGIVVMGAIGVLVYDDAMEMNKEAVDEDFYNSNIIKWSMIIGYVMAIVVFIYKRYVKVSLGRLGCLEHSSLLTAAGMAALIAVGWMFTEVSCLTLVDAESLFPDDAEQLEKEAEMFGGILGFLAAGILAPIAEEITFRGIMMRGLLKMRCRPWVAIGVSAFIFALFHGTELQLFGTTMFGIIVGWLYWRTKSILPGMIVHMVNNCICITAEYLFPDYEPDTKACLLILAVSIPLLMYGLNWYKEKYSC
jgi:hypothetical protein